MLNSKHIIFAIFYSPFKINNSLSYCLESILKFVAVTCIVFIFNSRKPITTYTENIPAFSIAKVSNAIELLVIHLSGSSDNFFKSGSCT